MTAVALEEPSMQGCYYLGGESAAWPSGQYHTVVLVAVLTVFAQATAVYLDVCGREKRGGEGVEGRTIVPIRGLGGLISR